MTAIIANTKFGPMIVPPYDAYLSKALIRNGEYCPDEFNTWRPYIPRGGIVIDVGANVGAHTMAFAQQVGKSGIVIAIEPQRALFNMLCGSIALCGATHVVTAKNCALGAAFGQVYVPPLDYGSENNFGALDLGERTEGEPVSMVPLDSWQIQRLNFLKIDVEGMELDVLKGAEETIERTNCIISAEADREDKIDPLIEWLSDHDYKLWWHRPLLGMQWPNIRSINLLCIPGCISRSEPTGEVELVHVLETMGPS